MEEYTVKYSCGCEHQLGEENGLHKSIGINWQCKKHQKAYTSHE